MEGVLWKWTNYWNGWQPRWFILDGGIMTYYKSQEEVNQGCKGSVKLSACEIVVHGTDNRRLDLVIPSEQHFYLRAATPSERQKWIVAIGSAKASLSSDQKNGSAGEKGPDNLKLKKSELRLYCDVLMQQVHAIKSSVTTENSHPEYEKMKEAAGLLTATCDTFIKTLDECMELANANFTFELPHQHVWDSALPTDQSGASIPSSLQSSRKSAKTLSQVTRSLSTDR